MKRSVAPRCPRARSRRRLESTSVLALLAGLVVFTGARSARADVRFSDDGPETVRRWYGYQTLISDAVSTSLFATGAATFELCLSVFGQRDPSCNNDTPAMLLLSGMGGFMLGAPVIHAANGQLAHAGVSLGVRVVPVVAAMELGRSGSQAAIPVLMLGAGTAMILDAGLLGYETLDAAPPKVSLAPAFDPKSRSGALVVAGSF